MLLAEVDCLDPKFTRCETLPNLEAAQKWIYRVHRQEFGFTETIPPRPRRSFRGLGSKITDLATNNVVQESLKYDYNRETDTPSHSPSNL